MFSMKTLREELNGRIGVFLFLHTKEAKEKLYINPKTKAVLKFYGKEDNLFMFLTQKTEIILYYKLLDVCDFSFYEENMNNKLEIEIPKGKEIDWLESAKQEKIVFKNKPSTYEEVVKKLFKDGHYFCDCDGHIDWNDALGAEEIPTNASSREQLDCILAKNKLANVAKYLNGDWNPKEISKLNQTFYIVMHGIDYDNPRFDVCCTNYGDVFCSSRTLFKSKELASEAIRILGKENLKLALKPLY